MSAMAKFFFKIALKIKVFKVSKRQDFPKWIIFLKWPKFVKISQYFSEFSSGPKMHNFVDKILK